MFFDSILKINKPLILLFSIITIATFWYIEKTKWIPRYGIVLYEMGVSCGNGCGKEEQLQYFQRAVRYKSKLNDTSYNDKLSDAYYRSGLIYEEIGSQERVEESFMRAVELNPKNVLAYYQLGIHYFQKEAYEEAVRYFRQGFVGQINCPDDVMYYVAKIYDKQKKYNLAIAWYNDFVESYPEHASEVYPRVAVIYKYLNDSHAIFYKLHVLRQSHKNDLADQLEKSLKEAKVSWAQNKE